MKMKKMLASLLSMSMLLALTACSGSTEGEDSGDNKAEPTTVMISYPVLNVLPTEEGTSDVEKAIDEYLEGKGEDVRIKLDPVDGGQYGTQMDMRIVGGESMDIYCPLSGVASAVATNSLVPLDDYLENELGPTMELIGDDFVKAGMVDGKVYAIPTYRATVSYIEWVCRKDIFDATGENIEDIKTLDDVERVLGKIKEQNPSVAALCPALGDPNSICLDAVYGSEGYSPYYNVGSVATVMGDDATVVNFFETDVFKEICDIAYRWNQAGYVIADASVLQEQPYNVIGANRAASFFWGNNYCDVESSRNLFQMQSGGTEVVIARLGRTPLKVGFPSWSIAHVSKNPSASAKVLNMLYTDEYVLNTIMFGLEGVSWIKGDEEGTIKWPEGKDVNSVSYTAAISAGTMGSEFLTYCMEGNFGTPSDLKLAQENMESAWASPAYGFAMNTASVESEVTALKNIGTQYLAGLYTGELNPDEIIPVMISEMKSAGSDDVVAEAQRQLDEWLK